jgi:hypothetical protein
MDRNQMTQTSSGGARNARESGQNFNRKRQIHM